MVGKSLKFLLLCVPALMFAAGCDSYTTFNQDRLGKVLKNGVADTKGTNTSKSSVDPIQGQTDDLVVDPNNVPPVAQGSSPPAPNIADQSLPPDPDALPPPRQQPPAGSQIQQPPMAPPVVQSMPSSSPPLRWLNMGDRPLNTLMDLPECTLETHIQRTECTTLNVRCRSKFATTCSGSSACRRVFKCTTGQTNTLMWFPMGDGHTTAATGIRQCDLSENIAGTSCGVHNDRCLSSFCTNGSGEGCGRRLFKCVTSGIPGLFYYRWMGDKPVTELSGIPQCAATSDIAGTQCFGQNTLCISPFFTDAPANTMRRLFKCTP